MQIRAGWRGWRYSRLGDGHIARSSCPETVDRQLLDPCPSDPSRKLGPSIRRTNPARADEIGREFFFSGPRSFSCFTTYKTSSPIRRRIFNFPTQQLKLSHVVTVPRSACANYCRNTMGQPSFQASNAIIYVTYGAFL